MDIGRSIFFGPIMFVAAFSFDNKYKNIPTEIHGLKFTYVQ